MAELLELGFASWRDGSFELIVRDKNTLEEVTLKGKLEAGQAEQVGKILPSCVFIDAAYVAPKRRYTIWIEGYIATGEHETAHIFGEEEANSFAEACAKAAAKADAAESKMGYYGKLSLFDAEKLTYWGCKLHDNERDARMFCG